MRRLALLLCLIVCVLAPVRAAGAADAALLRTLTATLADTLADTRAMELSLAQLRHFRDADFIYQPSLSVSSLDVTAAGSARDTRAVLSGMLAVDRDFAFFFGSVDDVVRAQKALRAMAENLTATEPPAPLDRKTIAALQAETHTQEGRVRLAGHASAGLRALLPKATADESSLRILGAHLYGCYIERLYVSGIMCLAAVEEGTADALKQVQPESGSSLIRTVELLGDKGMLGRAQDSAQRRALVKELQDMIRGGLNTETMSRIVDMCGAERDRILAGDQS